MTLKFLADEAIPFVEEAFSTIGEVEKLPASNIDCRSVRDVDGLIVRSVTKITRSLLHHSKVKFVGSATIGTDHVDFNYLNKSGVAFTSAPGCSSITVAEFVLHSVFRLAAEQGFSVRDRTFGIIGVGNIGSELKKRVEILGAQCLLNDPPLQERTKNPIFLTLNNIIERADVLSLHVPLTSTGKHPTVHLINESALKRFREKTIWINTSRGGVIDESALLKYRDKFGGLVSDVWENEPNINKDLVKITDQATPHIAGYSIEGKIRATQMVYEAACRCFKTQGRWNSGAILNKLGCIDLNLAPGKDPINETILNVYNIRKDDSALRNSLINANPQESFSELRNKYSYRREFSAYRICENGSLAEAERNVLAKLGFKLPA